MTLAMPTISTPKSRPAPKVDHYAVYVAGKVVSTHRTFSAATKAARKAHGKPRRYVPKP
jgi:hypothetical protein